MSPSLNQIPALWYLQVPATFSYLEDVAKAISKACSIPWMKAKGFFLVMRAKSRGKRMIPWKASPDTTVMTYSPSFCPITDGSSISKIFPAMRNTMPKGKYLQRISIKNYEDAAILKHCRIDIAVFGTMRYSCTKANSVLTTHTCRRATSIATR